MALGHRTVTDVNPLPQFAAKLRELQSSCGSPSIRDLAGHMRAGGTPFARSTINDKLTGVSRPTWEFVEAFVAACTRFGPVPPEQTDLRRWRHWYHEMLQDLAARRSGQRRGTEAAAELEAATAPDRPVLAPRELPPDVADFTGRADELAGLDDLLATAGRAAAAVTIGLVSGTAGAGKTALTVHWAHRVADSFPDGQLYVDLRGYDSGPPITPAQALAGFLRALGVPGTDIPHDVDGCAARYRSLVAGRRMLIVLDNAYAVDQVKPLLPGSATCFVLVTSRDSLGGLVARHGARRIGLDRLPPDQANTLLRGLIGPRVDAEPAAAADLAERCARLPLALRIAAERAATNPDRTLADLAATLADERRRLDQLDAGSDDTDLRAVFSWSYRRLSAEAARAFRLLALHPGREADSHQVGALTGTDPDSATRLLDILLRAHLVQRGRSGRIGLHDLLRAYAAELVASEPADDQHAALDALLWYYANTASAAIDAMFPADADRRPRLSGTVEGFASAEAARQWLDAERSSIVAASLVAARQGWPDMAVHFGQTIWRYLDTAGHHGDAILVQRSALDAAEQTGDGAALGLATQLLGLAYWRSRRISEAVAHLERARERNPAAGSVLNVLGLIHADHGRYELALDLFRQAHAIAREAGVAVGCSGTLGNMAMVCQKLGRHAEADANLHEAIRISQEAGDLAGQGKLLGWVAVGALLRGRLDEARSALERAVSIYRQFGDRTGLAWCDASYGWLYREQGRLDSAHEHLARALAVFRELGDLSGESDTVNLIGYAYAVQSRFEQAREHHLHAVDLARRAADPRGEADALNGLGECLRQLGRTAQSRVQHDAALRLARRTGLRWDEARALDGLACLAFTAGRSAEAQDLWHAAQEIYSEVDSPSLVSEIYLRPAATLSANSRVVSRTRRSSVHGSYSVRRA